MTTPPPTSLFSPHGGCSKRRIDGCLVDIDNEDVPQSPLCPRGLLQPVSLHLSFNKNSILSFRLRISVALRDVPGFTAILLDIPADKIISLSLSRQPTLPERLKSKIHQSQARLQVTVSDSAGILIAPSDIKALNPERPLDAQALETMRVLSRSRRILTYLPVGDKLWEYVPAAQGTAVPNLAMSSELLQVAESPVHLDLMTLYAGKGGRIISSSEAFGQPVIKDDAQDSSSVGDASSTQEADLPPSYNDTAPYGAANSARKRPRSSPGNDAPQSRKGEASDDKAGGLDSLREAWDQAGAMIEKLRESTAAAAAMDARLRATVLELKKAQHQKSPSPQVATFSPAASTAETASHTSSVSEAISDRLKAYLDDRLARFSQDMRARNNRRLEQRVDEALADYATVEYMEQHVRLEFGELAVDFVDQHEMWDAIQEAVDKVEENMRTRMLDAWST